MPKKMLPDGWSNYTTANTALAGTKIIPFKTPLVPAAFKKNLTSGCERWTPEDVISTIPNLGLVIYLSYICEPFYKVEDFKEAGISWEWIKCTAYYVPDEKVVEQFAKVVKEFASSAENDGKFIGVHCTHGVNITGYVISRYLVNMQQVDPEEAMNLFAAARGYEIEREEFVHNLFR